MSKFALCAVAVSGLVFLAVASAPAAAIAFLPALIPVGQSPEPVPLAIYPAAPTTTDIITFIAPLDGQVYSNKWLAANALFGNPVLSIDEAGHTINIYFDGTHYDIFPMVHDPVLGASGDFGPLDAGKWTLYNSSNESLEFTVLPEPASLLLLSAGAAGLLARRRRKR